MVVLTEERLKKKYLEDALATLRSDRSMAAEKGFKEMEWPPACSREVEKILEIVIDMMDIAIKEQEEAEQMKARAPKKAGKYMGVADAVENGDYV